jgi:hypothetical protein
MPQKSDLFEKSADDLAFELLHASPHCDLHEAAAIKLEHMNRELIAALNKIEILLERLKEAQKTM